MTNNAFQRPSIVFTHRHCAAIYILPIMEMIGIVLIGLPLAAIIFGFWRFHYGNSQGRRAAALAESTLLYLESNQQQTE